MNLKTILAIVLVSITTLSATAQSAAGIVKIRQAQDMAVERIVSSLNNTNCHSSVVSKEVKGMADALVLLQQAESKAYVLANERDVAPQTMTKGLMERSLAEAKELGVGRGLRNNLRQEWQHARTLEQADRVIASAHVAINERANEVADRGSFRRFLPEFVGGTSSYANHRVPQPVETGTALATKLGEMEKRLIGIQAMMAPTMIK